MNSFRMDITWCCPKCDEFNHDKQDTNEGVVNELQCHNCFVIFNLETQEQNGGIDGTTC